MPFIDDSILGHCQPSDYVGNVLTTKKHERERIDTKEAVLTADCADLREWGMRAVISINADRLGVWTLFCRDNAREIPRHSTGIHRLNKLAMASEIPEK